MTEEEGEITFEEQLALEQEEKNRQLDVGSGKVKVCFRLVSLIV